MMIFAAFALTSGTLPEKLQFAEKAYDFGTIADTAAPVVHEFGFVNTAGESVVILSASASCGCTRPEYPKEPIAGGKAGTIKVTFLPGGQSGEIDKHVKVRYRGATSRKIKRITLRMKGVVIPSDIPQDE